MTDKMISVHDLAQALAKKLVATLPAGKAQAETQAIVAYGLELGGGALWELFVLLALAAWLGLFQPVALAILASGSFRIASGGAHCTAYYRCLLSTLALFGGLGWLAVKAAAVSGQVQQVAAWVLIGGFALYAVTRWAPAATPNAPISSRRRPRLRRLAYLSLALWLGVTLAILLAGGDRVAFWAILLAIGTQSFTLTPPGYTLIDLTDRSLRALLPLDRTRITSREEAKE